jgi:hypothetical protein
MVEKPRRTPSLEEASPIPIATTTPHNIVVAQTF